MCIPQEFSHVFYRDGVLKENKKQAKRESMLFIYLQLRERENEKLYAEKTMTCQ